jgi:diguanylate cyclase (GGDEF)-like protein
MKRTFPIILLLLLYCLLLYGEQQLLSSHQTWLYQLVIVQLYLLVVGGAVYYGGLIGIVIALVIIITGHTLLAYQYLGLSIKHPQYLDIIPIALLVFNSLLIAVVIKGKTRQLFRSSDLVLQRQLQEQNETQRKLTQTCEAMKRDMLYVSSLIITLADFAKKINLAELTDTGSDELSRGNKRVIAIIRVTLEALSKSPNTKYSSVYLFNPHLNILERQGIAGSPLHDPPPEKVQLGEGILGRVAETRQTMRYEWSSQENWQTSAGKTWLTELTFAIPILYQNQLHGAIYVEKSGVEFQDERLVSETIAGFVGMALQNAAIFDRSQQMAITDGLTKLNNHEYFILRLNEFYQAAKRYNNTLSLIMIDIDHFKHYNDTNGHPMGDVVLEEVSFLIRNNTRETDLAARYGGEEFALILQQTDLAGAVFVADKIRKAVEEHHFFNEEKQPDGDVTISVGVATLTEYTITPEKLLKDADEQLYIAKRTGRNKVCSQG